MTDNIDHMLQNQEKAEVLKDKTETLAANSNNFKLSFLI